MLAAPAGQKLYPYHACPSLLCIYAAYGSPRLNEIRGAARYYVRSAGTSRYQGSRQVLRDQAVAMFLPGIGSASAARQAGAPKGSAKYCVSCTTCTWANSMMLTE
jgi:hypothetical protein